MASLNLKIKSVVRPNLYYGKYNYLISVEEPNLYFLHSCHKIDTYIRKLDNMSKAYDSKKVESRKNGLLRYYDRNNHNIPLAEEILRLRSEYKDKKTGRMRLEGNRIAIFTNDAQTIDNIYDLSNNVSVEQVELSPTGVMYFAKKPPANYRIYMKDSRIDPQVLKDMNEYLDRTPDVRPNKSFYRRLQSVYDINNNFRYRYLFRSYFLDLDDDKNLMMLTLLFSDYIGKKYKLEQKPK